MIVLDTSLSGVRRLSSRALPLAITVALKFGAAVGPETASDMLTGGGENAS